MIQSHRTNIFVSLLAVAALLVAACAHLGSGASRPSDPLPSWHEGAAKANILTFVERVTTPDGPDFVEPAERIAVFDNDGTLWVEQPIYTQLAFVFDRVAAMASKHPEWRTKEPFTSALARDMKGVMAAGEQGLVELILATHAGMTTDEFADLVKAWIADARHPRFDRSYTDLVYLPMLELLNYLRANGFKTFIVSGGGVDFMRPWTEAVYGIPPEQVVGTRVTIKFDLLDGRPVLLRLPEIDFIDDKEGKPVGIHQHIGRRPIAAFGNSDGDLAMLQWTAAGSGPRFCLYVRHTDGRREWAYDRNSPVGRLDKGLDEARDRGWTVVDMQKDWRQLFAFEPN